MPEKTDEFRHEPGPEKCWNDSWYFNVVAADASWALSARLALFPNLNHGWWWAVLARADAPILLVRDHSLALPKHRSFEIRGQGLWLDLTCHTPMERWQVNFEGIALALDDPNEVGGASELGHHVPVEFEFEWEATARPLAHRGGYSQRCSVHGEAMIGTSANVLSLEEPVAGRRDHSWGP